MDLAQCGGIARIVEREELDPVIAEAALLPGQIDAIFPVGDVGGDVQPRLDLRQRLCHTVHQLRVHRLPPVG